MFCHLCVWVRNSADRQLASLPALTDEIFYKAVEAYVELLVLQKRTSLVATYCAFLSPPRRIHAYVIIDIPIYLSLFPP